MSVLNGEVFYDRRVSEDITTQIVSQSQNISLTGGSDFASVMSYFPDPNGTPITVKNANSPSIPVNNTGANAVSGNFYVRSEYAPAYGVDIEKKYRNITNTTLHTGDRIQVEITLKNTTTKTITDIRYLDTIPKIFILPSGAKYRSILGSQSREAPQNLLSAEDYQVELR